MDAHVCAKHTMWKEIYISYTVDAQVLIKTCKHTMCAANFLDTGACGTLIKLSR